MAVEKEIIEWIKSANGVIKNKEYDKLMDAFVSCGGVVVRWSETDENEKTFSTFTKHCRLTDSAYDAVIEVYENWLRSK